LKVEKVGPTFSSFNAMLAKTTKSYLVIVQMFAPDVTLKVKARLAIRKRADLSEANTLPQRKTYTDP